MSNDEVGMGPGCCVARIVPLGLLFSLIAHRGSLMFGLDAKHPRWIEHEL
jgi:hypothetical protein